MLKISLLTLIITVLAPLEALSQTWEYKVEEVDLVTKVRVFANDVLLSEDDLEELLAPLGEDGWELTQMIPRGGTSMLLVFKRPVAPPLAVAPPVAAPYVVAPPAVDPPAGMPAPDTVPDAAPPTEDAAPVEPEPVPASDGEGAPG